MNDEKKFLDHTFVICAYQQSEYLEENIKSLLNQKVRSNILIATSTPNEMIEELSKKYGLEVVINTGKKGIGPDWNFAVSQAKTKYVTISHQDDLYSPDYTKEIQKAVEKNDDIIMLFTGYKEIRNGKIVRKNINLMIKWLMILPIRMNKRAKKMIVSFGNPVCCPSVCLNTQKVGKTPFREDMKSNIDWGTWLDFAKLKGKFIYLKKNLTFHRVHRDSETSNCLNSNQRYEEDYQMFCRIWPKWFAKFLMVFYKSAGKANQI